MCDHCHESKPRRKVGIFRTLMHLLLLYALLVFGAGTLIHTGHPVAVELGRLIHTVTFVEPGIYWAESSGLDPLADGLRLLAHGVDVARFV
ncbi:MAG: hypothetical protein SYC29_12975 [Planctomycetota bacterium]|nr:hypothetical protein [Planctomycetota bacterium]